MHWHSILNFAETAACSVAQYICQLLVQFYSVCGNTNEVNIAAEEETTQWHYMWMHYELDMKLLLIKKLGVGIFKKCTSSSIYENFIKSYWQMYH